MKNPAGLSLREATLQDAERLLEIYRYYVERTAISFECAVPSPEEFRERMRRVLQKYPYIVAERDGRIVGYAYAGAFVGREAYDYSVETTIYLDAGERHRGLGKRLYLALEEILKRMHVLNLNACIGYPVEDDEFLTKNSAQFHEHLGFRMVGKFHGSGYKFGKWYDMIWMEKLLGAHPLNPPKRRNFGEIREELPGIFSKVLGGCRDAES